VITTLLQASATNLAASDRRQRIAPLVKSWIFAANDRVPQRYALDVFPEIASVRASVTIDIHHHFELPYGERVLLDAIVRHLSPDVVFELGTYSGTTTKLLAEAAPRATVHTIDIPSDNPIIGSAYRDDPGRIVSHRANIRSFDFAPYERSVDLVFVDASHEYADVLHDSNVAKRLIGEGGVIVWDDYHPAQLGVVRALSELQLPLWHLTGSRMVVHVGQQHGI
jgi:hypothetical protein